ncbi:MAG: hypothetical protein FJ254_09665, partial [Phycisphaerae bacterium]|nr:hypothetical protein [Phycisphaerae bacterium]
MKSFVSLTAGAIAVALVSSADGAMIAGWSIATAIPAGSTGQNYSVGVGDQGDQTAGSDLRAFHALTATTYSSPSGNGSQYSFSSNNWSVGDYYEARVSTAGYSDISVSWDQTRSSTGPSSFRVDVSTDGTNFT